MKHLIHILIAISLPCLALQCNKDDNGNTPPPDENKEQLPPATQTGEGTFGCKVNGEVWRPEAPPNINELHADYYQDEFFVSAERVLDNGNLQSSVAIQINSNFEGEKDYKLSSISSDIYSTYRNLKQSCNYDTDSFNVGKLTITHFDSSKRIVSGRFQFTAVIKKGKCENDTIRITEGRFDIQD